jgi:hypothetical protein
MLYVTAVAALPAGALLSPLPPPPQAASMTEKKTAIHVRMLRRILLTSLSNIILLVRLDGNGE